MKGGLLAERSSWWPAGWVSGDPVGDQRITCFHWQLEVGCDLGGGLESHTLDTTHSSLPALRSTGYSMVELVR